MFYYGNEDQKSQWLVQPGNVLLAERRGESAITYNGRAYSRALCICERRQRHLLQGMNTNIAVVTLLLAGATATSSNAAQLRTQCLNGACYWVRCDDFGAGCVNLGYRGQIANAFAPSAAMPTADVAAPAPAMPPPPGTPYAAAPYTTYPYTPYPYPAYPGTLYRKTRSPCTADTAYETYSPCNAPAYATAYAGGYAPSRLKLVCDPNGYGCRWVRIYDVGIDYAIAGDYYDDDFSGL